MGSVVHASPNANLADGFQLVGVADDVPNKTSDISKYFLPIQLLVLHHGIVFLGIGNTVNDVEDQLNVSGREKPIEESSHLTSEFLLRVILVVDDVVKESGGNDQNANMVALQHTLEVHVDEQRKNGNRVHVFMTMRGVAALGDLSNESGKLIPH